MEELFLDWLGSALAGKGQHPIPLFERYAERMGPADGSAQILPSRRRGSPYFAALVNGAASHVVEQDDLHNSSVLHPRRWSSLLPWPRPRTSAAAAPS